MKQQRSFSAWLLVIGIFGLAYAKEYQQHEFFTVQQVDVINRGGSEDSNEANYQIKSVETTRPVADPSFSEDTALDSSNGIKSRVRRGAMLCHQNSQPARRTQHATRIDNNVEHNEWLQMCQRAHNRKESNAVDHVHSLRQKWKQELNNNFEMERRLYFERNQAQTQQVRNKKNQDIVNVQADQRFLITERDATRALIDALKTAQDPARRQAAIDAIERYAMKNNIIPQNKKWMVNRRHKSSPSTSSAK